MKTVTVSKPLSKDSPDRIGGYTVIFIQCTKITV